MKSILTTLAFLLLCSFIAIGAPRYWIGPLNGNWSDPANWSEVSGGTGGATVPGSLDSVVIRQSSGPSNILIRVDVSPTISQLRIGSAVKLYVSTPVTFIILRSLIIEPGISLLDSTSADVPFNVVFRGATQATGLILGSWIFAGGVPVNRLAGNGAGFTAEPGSNVQVRTLLPGRPSVIFRNNTRHISSDPSSLIFFCATVYVLENNLDGAIPNATWRSDSLNSNGNAAVAPASLIRINGSITKLTHLSPVPQYKDITVDLPGQLTDASLDLPDGMIIQGALTIDNTNNRTLTLLAANGPNSSVTVDLANNSSIDFEDGTLRISGNSKVAMATATSASAATAYRLQVLHFNQTGGAFSLQDYNDAMGTSTLSVSGSLSQSGGTFFTNSTTTNPAAKFIVEMNGPHEKRMVTSNGDDQFSQSIGMIGGTIDNGNHKVTLRISNRIRGGNNIRHHGVNLSSPLTVARLEMIKGTLNTRVVASNGQVSVNILTVLDPDPKTAVTIDPQNISFVNGPLRRWTNSASAYTFPTGYLKRPTQNNVPPDLFPDSVVILPVSAAPSLYEAEYFPNAYTDLNVSAPLKGVSNSEYWNIEKISGADAAVKLVVNAPGVPGATSADALVAAHYVNGSWIADHGTVLTPGNTTSGSVLSKPLSAFGPFTFGYADPASLNPNPVSGLNYRYYEGTFNTLPDFNALTPVKTGNSANIDLGVRTPGRNDNFAFVWEGKINIPTPGIYTFETVSDDGSKLYFNSLYSPSAIPLVNNDGLHAPTSATGTINITAAGLYPISITFFEKDGGEQMQVYWTGPGISRQLIPNSAFTETPPQTSNGLVYKYYEGTWTTLPNFSTLTPVKTGSSDNVDLSVRTPGRNDLFGFVWEGYIQIPTAGMYTFETVSDDGSKLYFNTLYNYAAIATVNNDGLHAPVSATGSVNIPNAGVYPISMAFFENSGGEQMQVYWSGPGIARQLIPNSAFTQTQPQLNGLAYKYYEGSWNLLPDFNTLTPVKTGYSDNVDLSLRTQGRNDNFAFVWEGYINIPAAGSYTFETISDDGSKLYFNSFYNPSGIPTVNNDGLHAPTSATGTVNIPAAGSYPISITFFEKDGGEQMQVYWSSATMARQLIPNSAFTQTPPEPSNGITYKYYEGNWNTLPNFNTLTPIKTGSSDNLDLSVRTPGRNDEFGFVWEGYLKIPTAGMYTFETISDDGSKFYFNHLYDPSNTATVNNDGIHAPISATGTVDIQSTGLYPISAAFFEKAGGETMQLYWTGPGIARQLIPNNFFFKTPQQVNAVELISAKESGSSLDRNTSTNTPVTRVYPNPFTRSFVIDFYNSSPLNSIFVGIYDLEGRLVYKAPVTQMPKGNTTIKVKPDERRLAPGVYMAELKINGVPSKMMKLIKVN